MLGAVRTNRPCLLYPRYFYFIPKLVDKRKQCSAEGPQCKQQKRRRNVNETPRSLFSKCTYKDSKNKNRIVRDYRKRNIKLAEVAVIYQIICFLLQIHQKMYFAPQFRKQLKAELWNFSSECTYRKNPATHNNLAILKLGSRYRHVKSPKTSSVHTPFKFNKGLWVFPELFADVSAAFKFAGIKVGRPAFPISCWKVVRNHRSNIHVDRQTGGGTHRYRKNYSPLCYCCGDCGYSIWRHVKCINELKTENGAERLPLTSLPDLVKAAFNVQVLESVENNLYIANITFKGVEFKKRYK